MTTVDELFDRYRAAYRAGEPADPRPYLDRLTGADRAELEALIAGFLANDPGRPYDPASFAEFRASPASRRMSEAIDQRLQETWATLLPEAERSAGLKRSAVVARLAQALGVTGREQKVGDYYHQMEHGTLRPQGVSDRVLEALEKIVGVPAERLRAAGQRWSPPGMAAPAPVFTRRALRTDVAIPPPATASPAEQEWDEVDELFRGGG